MKTINPITPENVSIHGLRIYFRHYSTVSVDVAAGETTVPVAAGLWFVPGEDLLINGRIYTLAAKDTSGNLLSLATPLAADLPSGTKVKKAGWYDMGHVQNPARTNDQTTSEIQSARYGKLQTVKVVTTSITRSMTFESISAADPVVLALYHGRIPTETDLGTFIVDDASPVFGELLVVQPSAVAGDPTMLEYKPSANLRGTDQAGSDGETTTALTFEASFLQDDLYRVPPQFDPTTPPAPMGVRARIAPQSLDAVLAVIDGTGA